MLRIQDIKKTYRTGELVHTALDGVSLTLRENEFVAILGPSGSGKTTLLNIIGGLDRYDSGDLIIDGISTKKYSDRDWDSYRNHTIGFVFQSYNLIPHQTVLANVELALTISGISRSERRSRAIKALEQVGLGNQLNKKPNQMSGGQMQRVAIARALVNNPSILLADEPTGALDSETSIQVMDLLKKVSKDRLVVMVTHNPELAMDYATRIVRVKDGRIVDDTAPYEVKQEDQIPPQHKNMGKSSMSFFSALALSFNNLKTKKGRTLLTAFAGSIGIIGIALILSLSAGFQRYIDNVQEDTLANYPLTIQSESADISSAFALMMTDSTQKEPAAPGTVAEAPMLSKIFAHIGANDLGSFKAHLEEHYDEIGHTLNTVQYGYNIRPRIYAENTKKIQQVNPASLFKKITGNAMISAFMDADAFHEMIDDTELLASQYQVLEGRWPQTHNELVFVLPAGNRLPDNIAYTLGLKDMTKLQEMMDRVMGGQEYDSAETPMQWHYEDLMGLTFRLVSVPDLYQYNEEYKVWEDMSENQEYLADVIKNGEPLKVVGIVCPKDDSGVSLLSPGIAYPTSLTRHVIEKAAESPIVQSQLSDMDRDVFSGQEFGSDGKLQGLNLEDMITIDGDAISSAFGVDMSESAVVDLLQDYVNEVIASMSGDITAAQQAFTSALADFCREMLTQFVDSHADASGKAQLRLADAEVLVDQYLASESAQSRMQELSQKYSVPAGTFSGVYKPLMIGLISTQIAEDLYEDMNVTVPTTEATAPQVTMPQVPEALNAMLGREDIDPLVDSYVKSPIVEGTSVLMAKKMMEVTLQKTISEKLAGFGNALTGYIGNAFYVDEDKLASAFHFNMTEEELNRLMDALSSQKREKTAAGNLRMLGYADLDTPSSMYIYMTDFDAKEEFLSFLDEYNSLMENSSKEEQVIRYTDMTGMMMSSVRTIINSISYVLIAFVAVSLVVSSIMIGIITYISVMERTKEIGVLRAMGASKRNISQVFNAETFIIGLFSGLMGIGITMLLLVPGNRIIHHLMGSSDITAQLPVVGALILIVLSMLLTLLGGLIPSKQAAKKDPVIALRSE